MEKTSLILLALTVIAALGVFNLTPETPAQTAGQLYQYKVEFEKFKQTFNKRYQIEEDTFRFKIFKDKLDKINRHNQDSTKNYLKGVTFFADMTTEEFLQKVLINDMMGMKKTQSNNISLQGQAPIQVDWRGKGVMTPVKNQGICGSCWAFSTTATLQSAIAIAKKSLFSFSEQQIVDCCGPNGFKCQGCSGGWPEWAFNYINSAGIVLEKEYAYTGRIGNCKSTPNAKKFLNPAKPWSKLNSIDDIKNSLGSNGPVSICVDASEWDSYKSGVFDDCDSEILNHCVTLVGYQADGAWIVRNEWGTSWGERGFIRLAPGGTCGMDQQALIPNLA